MNDAEISRFQAKFNETFKRNLTETYTDRLGKIIRWHSYQGCIDALDKLVDETVPGHCPTIAQFKNSLRDAEAVPADQKHRVNIDNLDIAGVVVAYHEGLTGEDLSERDRLVDAIIRKRKLDIDLKQKVWAWILDARERGTMGKKYRYIGGRNGGSIAILIRNINRDQFIDSETYATAGVELHQLRIGENNNE